MKPIRPAPFLRAAMGAALLGLAIAAPSASAGSASVVIGTGGFSGVYEAAGAAICRLVMLDQPRHGIGCTARPTLGSIVNLAALRGGDLDFGLAQSDTQDAALRGRGAFEAAGPDATLRAVFSLHAEPFTVVARREAGVRGLDDLRGKRLSIGGPGSGTRATFDELLRALGGTPADYAMLAELHTEEQGPALCDNRIDAFFYGVGHPSATVLDAVASCGARLVPLKGPAIERLLAQAPYYRATTIAGGLYRGHPDATPTFGAVAVLVTSSRVPEDTVYELVRSVFAHLNRLRRLHPALGTLDPRAMVRDGITAPLHPGALRYFREQGWQ